jgi:hypothetical protein
VIWRRAAPVAAATSESRDRVVDLLRVASLTIVVMGHALMAVVLWQRDTPRVANLLAEIPELKVATWALQIMPVFFAAGAISNRSSYGAARTRGEPWRSWVWHRQRRLVRPLFVYLAVWIPLVLALAEMLPDAAAPLGKLSTQLLWFLGVYLLIIMTTPWQVRLSRYGLAGALMFLVPVALIDVGRFHVQSGIGVVNFLVVWFMTATLGLAVRDRVDAGAQARRQLLWLALAAVALNLVLVNTFPYPVSMVGMPGEPISNMAPPTVVLALHCVVLIAIVGWAWPSLRRWCERPRAWHLVVAGGAVAMTLYLWHLTALVILTVAEHEFGLDRGPIGPLRFWPATLVHLVVYLANTAVLVAVMARFEHVPIPWLEPPSSRSGAGTGWSILAGVGALVAGLGLLALAATGMGGFPFGRVTSYAEIPLTPALGMVTFAVGVLMTRAGGRREPLAPTVTTPSTSASPKAVRKPLGAVWPPMLRAARVRFGTRDLQRILGRRTSR